MARIKTRVATAVALAVLSQKGFAEGSVQVGLNQPFVDYDIDSKPLHVDILNNGEVINVSLCGNADATTVSVEIFDPNGVSVLNTGTIASNLSCTDPMSGPLTGGIQYTTTQTGTFEIRLRNVSGGDNIRRFDVTVTPDAVSSPDPTVAAGRLWAHQWAFSTGSFTEADATDANYYALIPGGRPSTDYVWQLDLNKFSGNFYRLVANDLGVDSPNSGYSTLTASNGVTQKFPMYLGYPAVANPRPVDPPVISTFRFIDDAGQDFAISPGATTGVQDSGNFEFETDVTGTYAITIDANNDGVFGAGDKLLLGNMVVGANTVAWNGTDATGNPMPVGTYRAQLQTRLGEYHFVANDAETSGGPVEDGLTIFLANSDGSVTDTQVYWDDETFLSAQGGASNLPAGALSSTPAGRHTWGDFTSTSLGNNAFVDTYVYGLASTYTALLAVSGDDTLRTGVDGSLSAPATLYPASNSLIVSVTDADLNIQSANVETATIVVTHPTTGEQEQLVATETGPNTGVFTATLTTVDSAGAGTNNDGSMNVQLNDVLNIGYQDQMDATGADVARTANTTILLDTDGDGVADATDLDDDNDGIPDTEEGSSDTDGDGVPDSLDLDSDNDGILDLYESGIANPAALDANGDGRIDAGFGANGLADAVETAADSGSIAYTVADTDGDGVRDFRDLDSDNDGLFDVIEAGGSDGDGDGVTGSGSPAVDPNGVPTAGALTPIDTDADGSPDQLDLDSDNDTLFDVVEAGGSDPDGDGLIGTGTPTVAATGVPAGGGLTPVDADGNGTPDQLETADADGDGISNAADLDDDNDGIPDTEEGSGSVDTDGDGVSDSLDLDSDNDGITDLYESGIANVAALDANGDGRIDAGFGANGLADAAETAADSGSIAYTVADTDGDGVRDFRDLDSDNDGLFDVIEAGGGDPDNDGVIGSGTPSVNASGIPAGAPLTPLDTDGDGVVDFRDLDSDNDGITDVTETGGSDPDRDGIAGAGTPVVDANGVNQSGSLIPVDSDGDGTPNQLDLDSDGDGINDLVEAGGADADANGQVDGFVDANGDGLDDALAVTPLVPVDADGDGAPDFVDADDKDGDGIGDAADLDDDNDGIPDTVEGDGGVDSDADGVPDSRDLDSDNDGILDLYESGIANPAALDADGDGTIDTAVGANGLADAAESAADSGTVGYTLVDTDSDGVPDFRDLDSDNDSIPDVVENGGTDPDGDGRTGTGVPLVNSNGVAARANGNLIDTDGDGSPNFRDLDSDNDGTFDLVAAGRPDADNNGIVDGFSDPDGDGFFPTGGANGHLETGLRGVGGCSVAGPGPVDPLLPAVALASLIFVSRKRSTAAQNIGDEKA